MSPLASFRDRLRRPARSLLATVVVLSALMVATDPAAAQAGDTSTVFINEFHYDNASTDVGEFVEVAGPAGTDLTGWSIELYNGSNGTRYGAHALSGTLSDAGDGYGFTTVNLPTNGLQNGSPDGIALVNGTTVVQFLSYEGAFAATDQTAAGITSTDVGVSEPSDTEVGHSLQLAGSGTTAGEFTWTAPGPATPGAANAGQTFGAPPSGPRVVINEIDYDQPSTDTAEFVELYNAGTEAADLTGWNLTLINGSNATAYNTIALSGSLAPGDFLVVCANAATVANCDLDAAPDTNFIQNGSPDAVTLTDGDVALVDAVSYEGSVPGAVEGSGDGLFDGSTADRSIARVPDGADTGQNNADLITACSTPGEANEDAATGCGEVVITTISSVQGSGNASPMVGQTVTVEGVVVGDYEGPSPTLRGFYLQEEDADTDGDTNTSEGIFVFNFSNDSVELGDLVRVTASVEERFGQTQLGFPSELTVVSSGHTVTPATVTLPLASDDALEAVEGMLVTTPQTLYVTEFYQLGRFGQVVVSSGDRLPNPTAVAEPGPDAQAVQAANDLNRLIIDDATNDQNPDPILFGRDGNPLTASNTLRGGDTITGAVGVMTYTWAGNGASGNAYRLRPVGDLSDSGLVAGGGVPMFEAANPRPTEAPDVLGGAENGLKVVSFNVLNYYLTVDTGARICGPGQNEGCRGADSDLELERQRTKLLSALTKLDADVVGLIEMENTPGVSPESDLASGLTGYAAIDAAAHGGGVVGPDAIRVGMIYRTSAVTPVGAPALLDFSTDSFGEDRSRTAVAQTFRDNTTGEVFTAVVNHFKSKSGSEIDDGGGACSIDPTYPDCDQGDGQGYFNATRTAHAAELVAWLAADPTGSGDADVLVLGDLNAYAMEDPLDVMAAAGYVDLTPGGYSFVFDGQWGSLDYALASASLVGSVTGAAHYHINADEPSALDYNTNFKSAAQQEYLYAPDEFRTSDHDPTLVGLSLGPTGFTPVPDPATLWAPNHKLRTVTVGAVGDDSDGPFTVEVLSAVSSEADSGLGEDDVPSDIVLGTTSGAPADTVQLRAERFAEVGRTYTLWVRISDGTQTLFTTTTVVVPHDVRGNNRRS